MTTPGERSRAFLAGMELLQELLDPKKTPRVPAHVRDRARRVLRHYPTASELLLALEGAGAEPKPLGLELFDRAELDRYVGQKHLQPAPAHLGKVG